MSLEWDEISRLQAAGFIVDYATKVAQAAGSMSIYISREHPGSDLYVLIHLPGGNTLGCTATRGAVLGINRGVGADSEEYE